MMSKSYKALAVAESLKEQLSMWKSHLETCYAEADVAKKKISKLESEIRYVEQYLMEKKS